MVNTRMHLKIQNTSHTYDEQRYLYEETDLFDSTVDELQKAVIDELNEPFFRIMNKHALNNSSYGL